ncbi:MAG: hypothetical protein WCR61_06170 [Bacteroidales bacterium]|nr:hypothetical protein [Bacteroidales bacterium]
MLDKRVVEFINEHHVIALTVTNGRDLWSWHSFYTYLEEENLFVITSESKTRHIQILLNGGNSTVAGAIALETEKVGFIRGVQLRAVMERCSGAILNRYRLRYLKRFPYAVLVGGDLWTLKVTEVKFTDNRLGFGKKLLWKES